MKFILFLLSCCIVVSWQQHPRYWNHPEFQPHQHFFDPYYQHSDPYYNNLYQKQDWRHYQHFYPSPPSAHSYDDDNYVPDEEIHSSDQVELDDGNEKEAQFRSFFFPKAVLAGQVYGTYTKYSIITTTISTTSFISCIPSGSFFGGSTQTCSRRKRLDSSHKELRAAFDAENDDGSLLRPTPVARLVCLISKLLKMCSKRCVLNHSTVLRRLRRHLRLLMPPNQKTIKSWNHLSSKKSKKKLQPKRDH